MPAIFALADKLIEQPQTSIFAAFGSFALLVLVEFGGPWRTRFLAYLGLACVGAAFLPLGTLCSRTPLLAAGAMALVGFATLFSGAFGGYFAAGATGALLTFVLPVTIPAPNSAIPDRLEGWGLAAGAGICAVMLLWPARRRADLQREAARALRAVAELLETNREHFSERAHLARGAVDALGRRLLGTQHRPPGPTGPTPPPARSPSRSRRRSGSGRQPIPPVRSQATRCARPGRAHRSSITGIWRSLRPAPRSKRRSSWPSSTRACAPCGSRTASAAPPGSRSPSTSPSGQDSSTASGSCSGRSPCCGRTRSAPVGQFSARSQGPRLESSSVRSS